MQLLHRTVCVYYTAISRLHKPMPPFSVLLFSFRKASLPVVVEIVQPHEHMHIGMRRCKYHSAGLARTGAYNGELGSAKCVSFSFYQRPSFLL